MKLEEILKIIPKNPTIIENTIKAYEKINSPKYKKISVAISGGADSDIMMDICELCDKNHKIKYIWCDTGLEYQATKDHLKYLEEKYNKEIIRTKAIKPIPVACKQYGQPFLSKRVSEYMYRLQLHNFNWADDSFENLYEKYPHCKTALKWWCNANGKGSSFNIERNKWLKEFIMNICI